MASVPEPRAKHDAFILHRSETHTQPELDTHNVKDSKARRAGRGFAADKVYPFKPLIGAVTLGSNFEDVKLLEDANKEKLARVDHEKEKTKLPPHKRREKANRPAMTEFNMFSEHKDNDATLNDDQERRDAEDDARNKVQHECLFDKDLPRCNGRDKACDGFYTLRQFISESETRVQQVQSRVPDMVYGLDYSVSMLDYLMPPREDYPAVTEKRRAMSRGKGPAADLDPPSSSSKMVHSARAELQKARQEGDRTPRPPPGAPNSARPPRPQDREAEKRAKHCPGRPAIAQAYRRQVYVSPITSDVKPRPLPIQLPSLQTLIDKDNYGFHSVDEAKGSDGGHGGAQDKARREPTDAKKELERKLRSTEKMMMKAFREQGLELEAGRSWAIMDDKRNPGDAMNNNGDQQGGQPIAQETTFDRDATGEAYQKVIDLMREKDPTISPVARLRKTLQIYQKARDTHRVELQDTLYSMDADRLHSLKRRAHNLKPTSHGATADAKTACQLMRLEAEKEMLEKHIRDAQKTQFIWYRDLWNAISQDKSEIREVAVAYFIFDFIKKVLEYGEEFTKEMYFSMLSKIDNEEYSPVIAKLVVRMLDGIEGIKIADLRSWFTKNRAEVPPKVKDYTDALQPMKSGGEPGEFTEAGNADTLP